VLGITARQFMGYTISPALRLCAGVLISAIAVLPLYLVAILLVGEPISGATLFPLLAVALMLTLAGVALVGLPVHAVLAALKQRGVLAYAAAGAAVPAAFLLAAQPFGSELAWGLPAQAGLAGIFGACVALVFWKVAVCPE